MTDQAILELQKMRLEFVVPIIGHANPHECWLSPDFGENLGRTAAKSPRGCRRRYHDQKAG